MKHFTDYSDDRNRGSCLYCGGHPETREHVPPRVFLDKPYPSNLPIVEACTKCNNGFSIDEEYMACLIDCVISDTVVPTLAYRESTRKSLAHTPSLAERIAKARRETDGGVAFEVECQRVSNIATKVAMGHVLYELGLPVPMEEAEVNVAPLPSLDPENVLGSV